MRRIRKGLLYFWLVEVMLMLVTNKFSSTDLPTIGIAGRDATEVMHCLTKRTIAFG